MFLVVSAPCLYVALMALGGQRPATGFKRIVQGAAAALPSLLVPAVLAALLPATYRPVARYFILTAIDHGALFVAVTAWWVGIRGYNTLENEAGRRQWTDFLSFACGFYTIAAVAVMLGHWGVPDLYYVLMLPVLRLAMMILASVLVVVYFESYGVFRLAYAIAYIALPFAAGLATYLERTHYVLGSILATAALASIAGLAWLEKERF